MEEIIAKLTAKDNGYACAVADQILAESQITDKWYGYLCVSFFVQPSQIPRKKTRDVYSCFQCAVERWKSFDTILDDYLAHITDDKPITARQCIKALMQVGVAKNAVHSKNHSVFPQGRFIQKQGQYAPAVEQDMAKTEKALPGALYCIAPAMRGRGDDKSQAARCSLAFAALWNPCRSGCFCAQLFPCKICFPP